MICKQCGIVLPWDGAKEITNCTICRKPFSTTADDVFRDGKFSICKEKRDGQYRLAVDIENTIMNNGILLAEGGTGIGKSFGYLVPGILSGRRMVIATAKKTLQSQLYEKDLPMLREKMPYVPANETFDCEDDIFLATPAETLDAETDAKFRFVNIKGKANYLCPPLVHAAIDKTLLVKTLKKDLHTRLNQIIQGVKYGSLRPFVERSDFPELSDMFADISLENCPNPGACKVTCKPRPKNYNIIVTNHHVLAYQLRYGEYVLGKFEVLIVDEAHHFEDAIRSAYTDAVGVNYMKKSLRILREDTDLRDMVEEAANVSPDNVVKDLRKVQDKVTEIASHARNYMDSASRVVDQDRLREKIAPVLEAFTADLKTSSVSITDIAYKLANYQSGEYSTQHLSYSVAKLRKIQNRITSLQQLAMQLKKPDPEKQFVLLYEERNAEAMLIRTPIEIGPLVQSALENIPVKVFVSATLSVNKSFSYFKKRVGLDLKPLPKVIVHPKEFIGDLTKYNITENFYESPFDHKRQARLYTPHHVYNDPIPNPSDQANHELWLNSISMEILRLCRFSQGDAFVLFTARTDLRDVLYRTEGQFKQYGLNLLAQQEEGAEELLQRYRDTPKSILFGLKSFWEGIDIAGEKLRLVIIPKLPFPNRSDAVIQEMVKRAGKNWFQEVFVPKMIFDLRQGTGRLIRTITDTGVIAILDTRIWTSSSNPETHANNWAKLERKIADNKPYGPVGYGKMIVSSLGFDNVVDNFNTAVNFLKESLTDVNEP
jgi:ATP-dependent DNA helicase DinG